MGILKRKSTETKEQKPRSLQEIVTDRVLTAEGWRRRTLLKKPKKK